MSSSWVAQVSGDPVLIGIAVDRSHRSHAALERTGVCGLNVVGQSSRRLEDYFFSDAAKQPNNLESIPHDLHASGVPILRQAPVVLICRVADRHATGDHTIFVAAVEDFVLRSAERPLTSQDLDYVYVGTVVRR
jgi:flavin reductase (DIM6/NTAB) family NADH-FMN oxidoreductase RutF